MNTNSCVSNHSEDQQVQMNTPKQPLTYGQLNKFLKYNFNALSHTLVYYFFANLQILVLLHSTPVKQNVKNRLTFHLTIFLLLS